MYIYLYAYTWYPTRFALMCAPSVQTTPREQVSTYQRERRSIDKGCGSERVSGKEIRGKREEGQDKQREIEAGFTIDIITTSLVFPRGYIRLNQSCTVTLW